MSQDARVVAMQLLPDCEVALHPQEELQLMAKKRIVPARVAKYNLQMSQYLQEQHSKKSPQERREQLKRLTKELGKMKQLSETDRVTIANNHYHNEAELLLKIYPAQALTPKERNTIMENQL